MRIRRKAIINKIMGEEAQKRGFTDLLMAAELEENGFENPYKNM
ncbi:MULTISPECIES: hypothetical protein [unclassified Butyrivibrio]|nr:MULTISPECIES: hypothetical protein [unclassified Butyrivibrio]MDC7292333.1 hypothetical protein [Butyrivibrio sp. DSM 10294]